MKGKDFLNSKWVQKAKNPETQKYIKDSFGKWSTRVKNTGILYRANQLWQYFISKDITPTQKITVAAALLYIISPLDFIPDFIPVVGWFDDIGVAGFVLAYIFKSMDEVEESKLLEAEIEGTSKDIVSALDLEVSEDVKILFDISSDEISSKHVSEELEEIADIAKKLKVTGFDEIIANLEEKYSGNCMHKILVAGRYSTGKSTLINALLEDYILPSSVKPTTKAITYLLNGAKELLFSEQANGEIVVHDHLSDLIDEYNKDIGKAKYITAITSKFPFQNLTIVDTPGLEDPDKERTQLTYNIVPDADVLIVVLDAGYFQSEKDIEFILNNYQDKKLFIVLNKIDKNNENIDETVKKCSALLASKGIHNQKIYPISAIRVIENDEKHLKLFNELKKDLFSFLKNGLKSEILNQLNDAVTSLSESMFDACNVSLQGAIEDKEALRQRKEEIEKDRDSVQGVFKKQEKELVSKLKKHQASFMKDFDDFCLKLKATAAEKINQASLDELKNSNLIAEQVKSNIMEYLSPEIKILQEKLAADVEGSRKSLVEDISKLKLNIDINTSDFRHLSALFVPAAVGAGFLYYGVVSFSFIGIIIAAVIGRNFFETSINNFLGKLAEKKIKGKLIPEVSKQIDKARRDIGSKFNQAFEAIEDDLMKSFNGDLNEQLAVFDVLGSADSKEQLAIIEECRKNLETLTIKQKSRR